MQMLSQCHERNLQRAETESQGDAWHRMTAPRGGEVQVETKRVRRNPL